MFLKLYGFHVVVYKVKIEKMQIFKNFLLSLEVWWTIHSLVPLYIDIRYCPFRKLKVLYTHTHSMLRFNVVLLFLRIFSYSSPKCVQCLIMWMTLDSDMFHMKCRQQKIQWFSSKVICIEGSIQPSFESCLSKKKKEVWRLDTFVQTGINGKLYYLP